ncbi:unnamed protein product [Closterium sp. Naga37s-1]|nr:unnamed protein product [Closterium sp. Naga37s-1]CAI5511314.1 unnamed protein product [Closterium sp. Naga37s-1]CAI5531353.1 unnamed protein product [Closterium sp. Naga37s-1]
MPPKWGSAGAAAANTSLVLLLYITPSAPGSSIFVQVNLFPFLQRKAAANTSLVLLLYITPSAPGSSIVVHVNLFPFLQRKAAANTSLVLLLYITPSAPGSSIVVQVNLVRPGDGKKLPSMPRWLRHIGLHQIYDGDSYFLHCQERVLQEREQQMEEARASKGGAQQGGGAAEGGRSEAGGAGVVRGSAWRAFYMPTNADLPVVAFRQWLSKYAGGAVEYPPAFSDVSLPPQPAAKEVVLERMASHTAHCTSCSATFANLQRLQLLLPAVSLLSAAAAAAASTSLRARVPLALLAVAAAAAAWKVQEFAKEFVYAGWDHARKD